jgi:hypothetical protein
MLGRMSGVGRLAAHVRGGAALRTPAARCHSSHTNHHRQLFRGGGGSLLPPTVAQLGGGLAGRGGVLQHVRTYGRGGDDDDWYDDDDEDDEVGALRIRIVQGRGALSSLHTVKC